MNNEIHLKGDGGSVLVDELHKVIETQRRRDAALLSHQLYGEPLPPDLFPPPKPLTLRRRIRQCIRDRRERLALWIAPWLEPEDPMDD